MLPKTLLVIRRFFSKYLMLLNEDAHWESCCLRQSSSEVQFTIELPETVLHTPMGGQIQLRSPNVTRRFVRVINGELISPFMDLRACRSPWTARTERKYGALSDHEKGLKCKNRRGRSRRPHRAWGSASVYVGIVLGEPGQPSC